MAPSEYWERKRRFLLTSEYSPLASLPMAPEALVGFGPGSAIHNAVECLVVGLSEQASAFLEFVPRLRAALADPASLSHQPEHAQRESRAYLPGYLHVGTWLLTGTIDPALAREAFDRRLSLSQWWGGKRYTAPNLNELMLLSIEAGDSDTARALYRKHEPRPLDLPPQNARFSSNPRAVLYACLPGHGGGTPTLDAALEAMRARACRWERAVTPMPYFMLTDVARTLRACRMLLGQPHDLATIVPMIA